MLYIFEGVVHEVYSPELVFDFATSDGTTINNVVIDYIELGWGAYFAIMFGFLGGQLDRSANFIYLMRLLGFFAVWTDIRTNPAFVDPNWIETIGSLVFAATMISITLQMIDFDGFLQAWTVFSLLSVYVVQMIDPYLRDHAGCSDLAGPPTKDFPTGVWMDCEDWDFAYATTWLYAGIVYVLILILCLVFKLGKNACMCCKWVFKALAVACVASSSAVSATKAIGNRAKFPAWFDTMSNSLFWIFLGIFFFGQMLLERTGKGQIMVQSKRTGKKGKKSAPKKKQKEKRAKRTDDTKVCCCLASKCPGCFVWNVKECCAFFIPNLIMVLAMPLILLEKTMAFMERKVIEAAEAADAAFELSDATKESVH